MLPVTDNAVIKDFSVVEVPAGTTAVLDCVSNDYHHNFMFWLFGNNKIIGPSNNYDNRKYKYEVLSGKLHINNVSPYEAGFYKCMSKKLDGTSISVGEVEMVVKGSSFSAIDAVELVAIVISIIVIIGCGVIYYRMRKEWNKYDGRSIVSADDPDEDDGDGDGDEVYNSTTTSINHPASGPSRNQSSEQLLYGIDNQGLDTDFNSVFENIQIKTPQKSLI